MKKFVIKAPKEGRTTCQLVTHRYRTRQQALEEGGERGTQTVYLGSFPSTMDPHDLDKVAVVRAGDASSGIALRPEVFIRGVPFELNAEDVAHIQGWLEQHGEFTKALLRQQQADVARSTAKRVERAALELELRTQVRADVLREIDEKVQSRGAIEALAAAIDALDRAGEAVGTEAAQRRATGHRLTQRRQKSTAEITAEDQLLAATLAVRRDAFSRFEKACQAAQLMTKKIGRRGGPKSG